MSIHDDIMMDDEGDNVTELVGAVEQGEQEFEFDDCSEDENDGSIDDKDEDDVSCDESESESSETDEQVDKVEFVVHKSRSGRISKPSTRYPLHEYV